MVVAVGALAGNAAEQRPGSRLPAVVHDRTEVDAGLPSDLEEVVAQLEVVEEVVQQHGPPSCAWSGREAG